MLGMKNKDMIMFGLIIGIALLFIGAIVSNVFPSSAEDLVGYKVSAFLKMVGLGFFVGTLIVGGIIVEDIDKNIKMLLLIFGLLILIIYTVGRGDLQWDVSPSTGIGMDEAAFEERPTGYGTPGFEMFFAIIAIFTMALISKIKKWKKT